MHSEPNTLNNIRDIDEKMSSQSNTQILEV